MTGQQKTQATVSLDVDIYDRCATLEAAGVARSIADAVRQGLAHPCGLTGVEGEHKADLAGVKVKKRKVERASKIPIVIGLDPDLRDRCDALRIVLHASRADVICQALIGNGLAALEESNAHGLGRLQALARRRGHRDHRSFVRALVLERPGGRPSQNLPSLEELEGGRSGAAARQALPATRSAKLSAADVTHILAMRANGDTLRLIADEYGVSESLVSRICSGKRRAA